MIAMFYTELEANTFSDEVHSFLIRNRPGYSATTWTEPNEGQSSEWYVKIPHDYADYTESLDLGDSPKTQELPDIGEEILVNEYFLHKGDIIKGRQTHNRSIHEPKDTPALFSFFRNNSDQLMWIENEQVEVGWVRIYNEVKYEVIQAHQTQIDWKPDTSPTLWKLWTDPLAVPENWAVGISYVGDNVAGAGNGSEVSYLGNTYRCLQSNVSIISWNPEIAITLWILL